MALSINHYVISEVNSLITIKVVLQKIKSSYNGDVIRA